jgi:hypothetical protein
LGNIFQWPLLAFVWISYLTKDKDKLDIIFKIIFKINKIIFWNITSIYNNKVSVPISTILFNCLNIFNKSYRTLSITWFQVDIEPWLFDKL